MRIVKTTHTKKGGKSKAKNTLKQFSETKQKAMAKVMENIVNQMRKIESDCLRHALTEYIGRPLIATDADLIKKVKTEKGYILIYDGIQIGEVERQHTKDTKLPENYRVLFTKFENQKLKIA